MTDLDWMTPPHDRTAERAVLGAMMLSPDVAEDVCQVLRGPDFYVPDHQRVFDIIEELRGAGKPADAVAVNAALQATGEITKLGPTLIVDLIQSVPTAANGGYYARIVKDRSVLRKVIETGTRFVQRAYEPRDIPAEAIADEFYDELTALRLHGMSLDDLQSTITHAELLAGDDSYDWLIPGLIERRDRVMITGAEGLGKSTLSRQFAICAAAGLHPFTHREIKPLRVLDIDCENGPDLSRRRFRQLVIAAKQAGRPIEEGRFWIDIRPEGLDLRDRDDARWLLRRVEFHMPDILVIGPIYKLHAGNPNDEENARAVAAVLDRARTLYGCALVIETHSPYADGLSRERPLRPLGSSLWSRWPDFGIGISVVKDKNQDVMARNRRERYVDVTHWRVARDKREWPRHLRAGTAWPWVQPPDDRWHAAELSPQDRAAGEREEPDDWSRP